MRDDKAKFDAANAAIFGVNNAGVDDHKNYCEKFGFPFPILSDADLKTACAYGADKAQKGVARTVVVIDPEGKVAYHKPGMPGDDEILAALK